MDCRRFWHAIVVCVVFGWSFPLVADEPKSAALLQTLPADGVWSTFHVNVKIDAEEHTATGTARSVGQVIYDGKPCRFIEYEQSVDPSATVDFPQVGNLTWRLLVPEEAFGEGRDPLSKAVKKWLKIDKRKPEVVESVEVRDPIFALVFQGPKKNLKFEDAKEKINWQRGNLECNVISGQSDFEFGGVKLEMTHRIFAHPDVPFGIAGMRQDIKVAFGGQEKNIAIRVSLRDHGQDAKAKLPELVP